MRALSLEAPPDLGPGHALRAQDLERHVPEGFQVGGQEHLACGPPAEVSDDAEAVEFVALLHGSHLHAQMKQSRRQDVGSCFGRRS